ncbi:MAG: hypothetical protein AB7E47_05595 [Desulfovibrionaceae bacterium]
MFRNVVLCFVACALLAGCGGGKKVVPNAIGGSIAGEYGGVYSYHDVKKSDKCPFTFTVEQAGTALFGTIREPRCGWGDADFLTSSFTGSITETDGGIEITFRKEYDYNHNHVVLYRGVYDASRQEIAGTWDIEGYTGPFAIRDVFIKP